MSVEDTLRLAWQAARDGRPGVRDALLTLAVAESGPAEPEWSKRCWKRLVTSRSDHLFSRFPNREQALADVRVAERLRLMRAVFPPIRVKRLLERAAVLRGTYTGRRISLAIVLEELLRPDEPRRAQPNEAAAKPPARPLENRPPSLMRAAAQAASERREAAERDETLSDFYLAVLLAIAMLLASTLKASDRENRAA
jgi:hypothetical protein